jgi:hypothetical protein
MGSSMVSAFVKSRKGDLEASPEGAKILLGREIYIRSPQMLRAHAHGLFS